METTIKERPILFSAPMVRALLDGSKTQTRRIVKGMALDWLENAKFTPEYVADPDNSMCPYGKVGDRLWVREKFQPVWADGFDFDSEVSPNYKTGFGYQISYPATDKIIEWIDGDDNITSRCRPSIHMPRWASRINLEITAVRVERLNDISEADARAEGVALHRSIGWQDYQAGGYFYEALHSFQSLWESINGSGSWQENPWVWVVEFKRV